MNNPEVFISYSWDSQDHINWVSTLANRLRRVGVDAKIDRHVIEKETVNLNKMMINEIKNSDYIIIILTKNYAKKANGFSDGVGYETNFLLDYIKNNLNKLISILRSKDKDNAIPFYLKGINYIDFSSDEIFEDSFLKLQHRIFNKNTSEIEPLGDVPDLNPKENNLSSTKENNQFDALIPNLKEITDIDKRKFLKESYKVIVEAIEHFSELTKKENSNFDFDFEVITSNKRIFRFYKNGNEVYGVKIWIGNNFGRQESIMISYGTYLHDSDTSMNEIINCEINENKQLILKPTMNIMNGYKGKDSKSIAVGIWDNIIEHLE